MKISIIVPVYNNEKYIKRCLESLILPKFEKEIIIIDDGSTDNSLNLINEFMNENKNENIVLLKQKNNGAAVARNKAIKKAIGDYIMFVDSDDFIFKLPSERLVKECRNNYDLIIGNLLYIEEKNGILQNVYKYPLKEFLGEDLLLRMLLDSNFSSFITKSLYKKEFLLKNNIFMTPHQFFEDMMFCFKALLFSEKVKLSGEVFYFYEKTNENSITSDKNVLRRKNKYLLDLDNILKENEFLEKEIILKYPYKKDYYFVMFDIFKRIVLKTKQKIEKENKL